MKTAIIIHGTPSREEYYSPDFLSGSHFGWIPWLQKQLIICGYAAHTPDIPNAWDPHYPTWQKELERFDITEQTILVGHSCGGGFLVRWLSEHPNIRVGPVLLVAPWLDPARTKTTDFFEFKIDSNLAKRTTSFTIFNSDNDGKYIQDSVHLIRQAIDGTNYREFHNYGHFCATDMETNEFPELLEVLIPDTKKSLGK